MISELRTHLRAAADRASAPLQPAHLHHDLARILRRSRPLITQARAEVLSPSQHSLDAIFRAIRMS